jgi:hypothetical protein
MRAAVTARKLLSARPGLLTRTERIDRSAVRIAILRTSDVVCVEYYGHASTLLGEHKGVTTNGAREYSQSGRGRRGERCKMTALLGLH